MCEGHVIVLLVTGMSSVDYELPADTCLLVPFISCLEYLDRKRYQFLCVNW